MTPWTATYLAPPSMGFSRQEYWSGLPLPSPIYAYDIILMTESEEEVKSLLMRLKEESEKASLKLNIKTTKIMASSPEVKVIQLCPTLCNPIDYTSSWNSPGQNTEVDRFPFSRGSSQPRDLTQVSLIAGRYFTN